MTPWPTDGLRRASVNSFGIGGTNSHAVLEDAYNFLRLRNLTANHCTVSKLPKSSHVQSLPNHINGALPKDSKVKCDFNSRLLACGTGKETVTQINTAYYSTMTKQRLPDKKSTLTFPHLLVWSAADEVGLRQLVTAYQTHFAQASLDGLEERSYLEALTYTLALRRTHLPWRSYALLESASALPDLPNLISSPVHSGKKLGIAFIFTGQGASYRDIGMELLSYTVFEKTLRSVDDIYRKLGCEWSIFGMFFIPPQISCSLFVVPIGKN